MAHKGTHLACEGKISSTPTGRLLAGVRASSNHYFLVRPLLIVDIDKFNFLGVQLAPGVVVGNPWSSHSSYDYVRKLHQILL